eukprot:235194_1
MEPPPPYQMSREPDECQSCRERLESDIKDDDTLPPIHMPPVYSSDDEKQPSALQESPRIFENLNGTLVDFDSTKEYLDRSYNFSTCVGGRRFGFPSWQIRVKRQSGFAISVLLRGTDDLLYRIYFRPPGFFYMLEMRSTDPYVVVKGVLEFLKHFKGFKELLDRAL